MNIKIQIFLSLLVVLGTCIIIQGNVVGESIVERNVVAPVAELTSAGTAEIAPREAAADDEGTSRAVGTISGNCDKDGTPCEIGSKTCCGECVGNHRCTTGNVWTWDPIE